MSSRRTFLKSSAGLAATFAAGALMGAQEPEAGSLPKVQFGKYEISRMVVGCNQFYGYSHFDEILNKTMAEWNTPERVCETLLHCEKNGINAYQYSHHARSLPDLELFRAKGGKMHLIAVDVQKHPVKETVRVSGATALYHHGEITDVMFRNGKMDQVQEYTKELRQEGVLVGVGTHKPEVVEYVEERGWDVDFYMLCAYNRTRTPEEIRKLLGVLPQPASELYLETDPPHAYQVARQAKKTCFLFKILAAGRLTQTPETVDAAFKQAFDSIKEKDCVVVGMYPRYKDEIKDNCERVRRILGARA
jgi:hypothetical protein